LEQKESVRAPELDGACAWLNVDHPLSLRELRGSVVLLDFWTYCCINCMHVLPTLREIERRHRDDPLVVIGVHSGKFSAERDPERIREAIGRYGVEHPVVVDDQMTIWSRYAIRSWPTLVIVRPDGKIAAVAPGEPDVEELDAFIAQLLEEARQSDKLAPAPPLIGSIKNVEHEPLCYPGKAIVLPDGHLAISDSGHHRVIVCARDGTVESVVGSGLRGLEDGALAQAAFDDPQGLAWFDGALHVADTRNHAIRRIDADRVTTVAGTGALGHEPPRARQNAKEVALRSPWDLCAVGDELYIAMAGSHQIWRLHTDGTIEVFAGSGVEALIDGRLAQSAWAQPSGLSTRDRTLYVADSETSAVRTIDLDRGEVRTLVGQGLFDFGDSEGDAEAALLQHCLGVAATEDGVLIVDTYNGKIKHWVRGEIRTVLGDLHEPGSLAVAADGAWIIADTNAHRVLEVSDGRMRTVSIQGAPTAARGALESVAPRPERPNVRGWFTALLELPDGIGLKPGDGGVSLILRTPKGTAFAGGSPLSVHAEVSRRSDLMFLERPHLELEARGGMTQLVGLDLRIEPFNQARVEAEIVATVDYVMCREEDAARCEPGRVHLRIPVRLMASGTRQLEFGIQLAGMEQ
jgi:thiol-disulfide isomerase/thioredoxin/sugar lactone lactonase YvrE